MIDTVHLLGLKDKALTMLRRDHLEFVFQAYDLVSTLTAQERITLPVDIAGAEPDAAWSDTLGIRGDQAAAGSAQLHLVRW